MHRLALCLLLGGITGLASAMDRLELAAGKASENLDTVRIAWQRSLDWQASLGNASISGYHALSVNHWWNARESITALGYSPVFTWRHGSLPWYLKGGIGVAWFSDNRIAGRELSTRFQFEDQIGIGWQSGHYDWSLVYRHYSNAGIEKPNQGLDLILVSIALTLN